MHHFIAICEFKLELWSGNCKIEFWAKNVTKLERVMSYCTDKLVITAHTDTQTDRQTQAINNIRRPKLASGKNRIRNCTDKLVITAHTDTQTDRQTQVINNIRRPKLASGKNRIRNTHKNVRFIKWVSEWLSFTAFLEQRTARSI